MRGALVVALLLLGAPSAARPSLSISVDEGAPAFRAVPRSEQVLRSAAHVRVVSTGGPWTLEVHASGPLVSPADPKKELPLSRMSISVTGEARRLRVSQKDRVLLIHQPATPAAGRVISLDYFLAPRWGDPALDGKERYQTQLVFTVTTEGADSSGAASETSAATPEVPRPTPPRWILLLDANPRSAHVGDFVDLEARIRSLGGSAVRDVRVAVDLPASLRAVPGTIEVDGKPVRAAPSDVPIGDLPLGTERLLHLRATVTAAQADPKIRASASGTSDAGPTSIGPVTLGLDVRAGALSGLGGIYGRVCWDMNADGACGASEPPARHAGVFLEEGSFAQADRHGRYHLEPVLPGAHALLAGPGPIRLGMRPGALPQLPRRGAAHRFIDVPAGQRIAVDLALPVPKGFHPEPDPVDALPSPDEGEVLPLPKAVVVATPSAPAPDEGTIGANGMLLGFAGTAAPGHGPDQRPTFPQGKSPAAPFEDAAARDIPPRKALTPESSSTALLGVGEAWVGWPLAPEGRLAFVLQQDFADIGRASLVVDTGREGTRQTLALLDPQVGQPEYGDEARVGMSTQDRLYLRFDLSSAYLQVGRLVGSLTENELIYLQESLLGAEVGVGNAHASVRAFAGFEPEARVTESLPGTDSTGPYYLAHRPVLPGSAEVDVEVRGPGGEVVQRLRQSPGVDYFLDETQGRIELSRPLPSAIDGNPVFLVVRYQVASGDPITASWLVGGRAQLSGARGHLGLTALYQARPGDPLGVATLDGAYALGPFELSAQLGTQLECTGPRRECSAGRARLTAKLMPGLRLFAYGTATGAQWAATSRSRSLSTAAIDPFPILGAHGTQLLASPALSLALSQDSEFPFFLPDQKDTIEWGSGTLVDAGPVRALARFRRQAATSGVQPARDFADLAVRADLGAAARVYAAHTRSAELGDLLGAPRGPRRTETLAGAQVKLADFQMELDWRHTRDEAPGQSTGTTQDVDLKLRYERLPVFQPAVLLSQTWVDGPDGHGIIRQLGAGIESQPSSAFRAFAFVLRPRTDGTITGPVDQAFAGVRIGDGVAHGLELRYDLQREKERRIHAFGWNGRLRLGSALTLESDGHVAIGDPARLIRFAVALTPPGPFRLLARAEGSYDPRANVPLTRLASADATFALTRSLSASASWLLRSQTDGGVTSLAGLAGLGVQVDLGAHWDTRIGARQLRDATGIDYGLSAEVGYSIGGLVRIGAGYDWSRRPEVFEIDRRKPGFFLHLTASYGGSFGVRPRPEVPEPKAVSPTEEAAPSAPSSAPHRQVPRVPRQVTGHVYVDLDGDGAYGKDDFALGRVAIGAGAARTKSDRHGRFALTVPAGQGTLTVVDPSTLPHGYRFRPVTVPASPKPGDAPLTVDLALEPYVPPDFSHPFALSLPKGRFEATRVDALSTPLASWVAGLPLTATEADRLTRLGGRVMEGRNMRLMVIAHAQTMGAAKGAMRRAWKGGRSLQRYLQATELIPGRRILVTVVPPGKGHADPLGHVELVLVRISPRS